MEFKIRPKMQVVSENINASTGIMYWCQVDIEPFHIKLLWALHIV